MSKSVRSNFSKKIIISSDESLKSWVEDEVWDIQRHVKKGEGASRETTLAVVEARAEAAVARAIIAEARAETVGAQVQAVRYGAGESAQISGQRIAKGEKRSRIRADNAERRARAAEAKIEWVNRREAEEAQSRGRRVAELESKVDAAEARADQAEEKLKELNEVMKRNKEISEKKIKETELALKRALKVIETVEAQPITTESSSNIELKTSDISIGIAVAEERIKKQAQQEINKANARVYVAEKAERHAQEQIEATIERVREVEEDLDEIMKEAKLRTTYSGSHGLAYARAMKASEIKIKAAENARDKAIQAAEKANERAKEAKLSEERSLDILKHQGVRANSAEKEIKGARMAFQTAEKRALEAEKARQKAVSASKLIEQRADAAENAHQRALADLKKMENRAEQAEEKKLKAEAKIIEIKNAKIYVNRMAAANTAEARSKAAQAEAHATLSEAQRAAQLAHLTIKSAFMQGIDEIQNMKN